MAVRVDNGPGHLEATRNHKIVGSHSNVNKIKNFVTMKVHA